MIGSIKLIPEVTDIFFVDWLVTARKDHSRNLPLLHFL
jgi:hypothetical protein